MRSRRSIRSCQLFVIALVLMVGAMPLLDTTPVAAQGGPAAIVRAVTENGDLVPGACYGAIQAGQANPQFRFGGVQGHRI